MKPKADRLVSEKCILRAMTRSDIPICHKWFNDDEVLQYSEHRSKGYTKEQQAMFYKNTLNDPSKVQFMIAEPHQSISIGVISFVVSSRDGSAAISIVIGERQYWGKGIATAAIDELIGYAVKHHNITRFTACADVRNFGSQKAFEKNGFVVLKVLPKSIQYLDEEGFRDSVAFEKVI
tara:strand:- start:87 stop:620 length:534 start_codon:yes stop_codon:yes gene_type:complete